MLAVLLLFPLDFNEAPDRRVVGPGLADLPHVETRFEHRDLAGLLFLPGGAGPFPAAVFFDGSGTSRRGNS